jgi:hypothetical protein
MESIYYVMTFLCHRNCPHCYEDRFHPYYGEDLERVAAESRAHFASIIANFPDTMRFGPERKRGRIILAGGEILLDAVRESVLYAGLDLLWQKYGSDVQLIVQTTGDLLNDRMVRELLDHHVELISVSGIDSFHAGLEKPEAQTALMDKLRALFVRHGVLEVPHDPVHVQQGQPYFHFFGANPGSWIGKLWPRGRAWTNNLSTATIGDNFCNGWSGGLRFLEYGQEGAEVSVDPEGNVFPCCPKTHLAIGNLRHEKLESILRRLRGNPVYEAINAGAPQRMGIAHGWTEAQFLERSKTTRPDGAPYANLCIGCDTFHREVLASPEPLVQIEKNILTGI